MGRVDDRIRRRARPIRGSQWSSICWSSNRPRPASGPGSGGVPNLCDGSRLPRCPAPRPAADGIDAGAHRTTQHKEELIATSPTEIETTVQDLARAIAAATIDIDDQGRRIGIAVYDLLARGDPVTPAEIAAHAREPEAVVVATLKGWPGVFWDDEGRVVGFWGLAIPEMDHRFHAENGKPMYAWCALDPFLIVPVIGRSARVESKDPVTGESITMTVTPQGIKELSPTTAVVSFLAPNKPFDFDVIESFCNFVLNFASRESAERWAAGRDGIVLLPTAEAFEVGLLAWSKWRSAPNAEGRARA